MYSKIFANTTMDTTTLIAYVVNCSVCFTIGLMFLLTPAQKTSEGKIESFSMARMCLAGSSFLESIVSFFTIIRLLNGYDYLPLNYFTNPLFLFFAICFDITACIYLLHGKRLSVRTIIAFIMPVVCIWLTHILVYIPLHGLNISPDVYNGFLETPPAIFTCYMLYITLVIEGLGILWFVSKQITVFRQHIDNYYIGENKSRSRWLIAVAISLILYYVVSIIDIALFNRFLDNIFMWIRSLVVLVNSVAFIKCRTVYWDIKPAFADMEVDHGYIFEPTPKPRPAHNNSNVTVSPDPADLAIRQPETLETKPAEEDCHRDSNYSTIDAIVTEWIGRADKPYLKDSITIMQVADQMGLNTRLLSNYINNVKGKNFNAWINFLKVEETKRVLLEDRSRPLGEIAYEMGFTDSASLSKIFKSIEGIPPSVYRQRH